MCRNFKVSVTIVCILLVTVSKKKNISTVSYFSVYRTFLLGIYSLYGTHSGVGRRFKFEIEVQMVLEYKEPPHHMAP